MIFQYSSSSSSSPKWRHRHHCIVLSVALLSVLCCSNNLIYCSGYTTFQNVATTSSSIRSRAVRKEFSNPILLSHTKLRLTNGPSSSTTALINISNQKAFETTTTTTTTIGDDHHSTNNPKLLHNRLLFPRKKIFSRSSSLSSSSSSSSQLWMSSITEPTRTTSSSSSSSTTRSTSTSPRKSTTPSSSSSSLIPDSVSSICSSGLLNTVKDLAFTSQQRFYESRIMKSLLYTNIPQSISSITNASINGISKIWWSFPLILCFVPAYCLTVHQTNARSPSWWALVDIGSKLQSSSSLSSTAAAVAGTAPTLDVVIICSLFLLSNIAYFLSGLFLMMKFQFTTTTTTLDDQSTTTTTSLSKARTKLKNDIISKLDRPVFVKLRERVRNIKSKIQQDVTLLSNDNNNNNNITDQQGLYKYLGIWMLIAGIVSTIFHSVQALGSYRVAESLFYLDHGIALSAGLYFFHTCGIPSRNTFILGCISLITLSITEGYFILHSIWHFLSAYVAMIWANDSYILKALKQQQQQYLQQQQKNLPQQQQQQEHENKYILKMYTSSKRQKNKNNNNINKRINSQHV